ncbi:MAG TPA: EAL domain-containing protein [Stellaceae bacterium]|nr:EAL domain-containing protein [Stellaceae bacterium]
MLIVAALGLALTAAASVGIAHFVDARNAHAALESFASHRHHIVQDKVNDFGQAIGSTIAFFEAQDEDVSPTEFARFADHLASIYGQKLEIAWAPRSAPQPHGTKAASAGSATDQFIIQYVAGVLDPSQSVGSDIAANSAQRALLEQAGTEGRILASPLETTTGTSASDVTAFAPVYELDMPHTTVEAREHNLTGFVRATVDLSAIIDSALAGDDSAIRADFGFFRADAAASGLPFTIISSPARASAIAAQRRADFEARPHWTGELSLADAHWTMIVAPTPHGPLVTPFNMSTDAAVAGLFLTAGLAGYLWLAGAHAARLRRMVVELRASETNFRTLFNAAGDGFVVSDLKTGAVTNANPAAERITGLPRAELVGSPYFEQHHLEAPETDGPLVDPLSAADSSFHEARLRHADGTSVPVEIGTRTFEVEGRTYLLSALHDITERKMAEQKLTFSNVLLNATAESSPDAILVVGRDSKIIWANRHFAEMWNLPQALIEAGDDGPVLQHVASLVKDLDRFLAIVRDIYEHPDRIGHDEIEVKDGRIIDRHTAPLNDDDHRYLGRVWFFRDITARRQSQMAIEKLAHLDTLTGLANRTTFVEQVDRALAAKRRSSGRLAVLYFDLDHFKDVNDSLGHPVGDALLRAVAARLKSALREADLPARLGGDEFAILQTDIADVTSVGILAQRLLGVLAKPFTVEGHDIRITASIGIALDEDAGTSAELLSNADLALYRAKDSGRNTFCVHNDEMNRIVSERMAMADELRIGLAEGQMAVYYQPQVNMRDGAIVGVEALLRWRHPQRGMIAPSSFIDIAERTGLIAPIGRWVMTTACRQMRAWIDAGIAPPVMAVNVSPVAFKIPNLEQELAGFADEAGLAPERLELEITENILMGVSERQDDVLAHLKQRGIRISIDDFGTGYSSFAYMKRFHPDRVKIAQEFIRGMIDDESDRAVVRAIIEMAHELRINVVAEGVETMPEARFLLGFGCNDVQGFLYSQAVPVDEITEFLRTHHRFPAVEGPARVTVVA